MNDPFADRLIRWFWGFSAGTVVLGLILVFPLFAQTGAKTTGPFVQAHRIESDLQRGISTKSDVERILGKPNGTGHSFLPTEDGPQEVWVYSNVETGEPRVSGGRPIKIEVDARQQIILIFFEGDTFDGYLWSLHITKTAGGER